MRDRAKPSQPPHGTPRAHATMNKPDSAAVPAAGSAYRVVHGHLIAIAGFGAAVIRPKFDADLQLAVTASSDRQHSSQQQQHQSQHSAAPPVHECCDGTGWWGKLRNSLFWIILMIAAAPFMARLIAAIRHTIYGKANNNKGITLLHVNLQYWFPS